MTRRDTCPHCGASLLGKPVNPTLIYTPEEWALPWDERPEGKHYAPHQTHFRREISVEDRAVYDGTLYWMCPDCGGAWHRWHNNSGWRYAQADQQIEEINTRLGILP